jgi:hypothetical protein
MDSKEKEIEAKNKRIEIIKKLEEETGSRVICYVTGDRPNLVHNVAHDAIRYIYNHLLEFSKESCEKISLYLYSRGGDTTVPWKMVNMIREFCKEFYVLVPYKAHSAATLIALGADKILMGKMGELSPIDPSVANPFNPDNPLNPHLKLPISVEDVTAYISLLKEKVGLKDPINIIETFNKLPEKIHPLALGNVNRSHSQIRSLASKLLKLHSTEEKKIEKIVDYLTEKLYTHMHFINRKEAKELDLSIEFASGKMETIMWDLYLHYEDILQLLIPFEPDKELSKEGEKDIEYYGVVIESKNLSNLFGGKLVLRSFQGRISVQPMGGWVTI